MSVAELKREMGLAGAMLLQRPYSCLLQVTNRCNMKCSFCDFWPHGVAPEEELQLEDFQALAASLSEMGRFLVSIEGGEPFVRPELVEIVRAFAHDHVVTLFTNGWYVTPENARALFDAGLAQVGCSLDYPDAARHDAKRGLPGTFGRVLAAIDRLKAAAPHGGKQVHMITVLMQDNADDIGRLMEMSAERGIGHVVTLLSRNGYRRGKGVDMWPAPEAGRRLVELWRRNPQWRFWGEYVERIEPFLAGEPMPTCRAGIQSFNIDHVGNVSPCVEKIDRTYGNIRREPLAEIHRRLAADRDEISRCQDCWTVCRAFSQLMGRSGSLRGWWDMTTRMRSR